MSAEYQALVGSISDLKAGLLDFPRSPTEPYTYGDLLKCQAFVVFAHAEMQVYWEAIARRILSEAEARWRGAGVVDRVLATLVAFRRQDPSSVPTDPARPHTNGDFAAIVRSSILAHSKVIGENNGIKRANIANLLVPLGVFSEDFDEPLLIQLDQTGTLRGTIVHKSAKVSLRTIRDPFLDEMRDIDNLVDEIQVFDAKVEQLGLLSIPTVERT